MADRPVAGIRKKLSKEIKKQGIDAWGVADAFIVNERAPRGFTAEDVLPGARTIIVIAQKMPLGPVLSSGTGTGEIFYMRSFWNSALVIDAAAWSIARMLEDEGFTSVPVPTYGPMRVYEGEPRGLVSLKHTAQIAGIGSIARNSLLVNTTHGNLLRLGGVVTKAPLPSGMPDMRDPCPADCRSCIEACPVDAIRDYSVDIKTCMKASIRHPLLRPFIMTRFLLWLSGKSRGIHGFVEDLNNMLVTSYSESCTRCLMACRYFRIARSSVKGQEARYTPKT